MKSHRFRTGTGWALSLAMFLVPGLAGARGDTLEYTVKAAYLTKFIPFIEWPEAAFAGNAAALTICVLGEDPFAGRLEQAASGQKDGDRALIVRHVPGAEAAAGCQLVFLGAADPTAAEGALDALKNKPVVTVTDSGMRAHGIISFLLADNHVRFDIDDAAAAQDGLKISSKLLGLAHTVKQRSTAP